MIDQKDFPYLLNLLAEDCGLDEAFALVSSLGGERVYVPEKPEGSLLAERAGLRVAACLSRHYAGDYVNVPQLSDRLRAAQREAWILAHPEATVKETSRILGMSRTGVQAVRRRIRERPAPAAGRPAASHKEGTSARP